MVTVRVKGHGGGSLIMTQLQHVIGIDHHINSGDDRARRGALSCQWLKAPWKRTRSLSRYKLLILR